MIDTAAFSRAREVQEAFARSYGGVDGVMGIGLALGDDQSSPVINVIVDGRHARPDLPSSYDGLLVRLQPSGAVRARPALIAKEAPLLPKMVRRR